MLPWGLVVSLLRASAAGFAALALEGRLGVRIGEQYRLYDNALFHTEVNQLDWDEAGSRWSRPER